LWDFAPASGNTQHCPDRTGAFTYKIEAAGPGGTSVQAQTINVVDAATATPVPTAAPELPVIYSFTVSPAQIAAGECTGVAWGVGGGTTYSRILRNGVVIVDNAGYSGQQMDCLDQAGSYTYLLEAQNAAGERVTQQQSVIVTDAAPENPLAGTRWQATFYWDGSTMQPALPDASLTVAFDASGNLNGSAGCNSYSARYTVQGSMLAITPPTTTSMICEEGVMVQENAFIAALAAAGSFSTEGNQLYISNASGQVVLELVAATP
jgi:heat shock protein HslJ